MIIGSGLIMVMEVPAELGNVRRRNGMQSLLRSGVEKGEVEVVNRGHGGLGTVSQGVAEKW